MDRVVDHHGIQMFEGPYLHSYDAVAQAQESAQIHVIPGDFLLVACNSNRCQRITPTIYLPEDLWFTPMPDGMVRATGWHANMQPIAISWVSSPRSQRIVRACTEALIELRAAPSSEGDVLIEDAIAHFEAAMRAVTAANVTLDEQELEGMFRTWADATARQTTHTPAEIADIVIARVRGPLPQTDYVPVAVHNNLDVLRTLVQGTRFVDETGLDAIVRLCSEITEQVVEEQATTEWQSNVLYELEVTGELCAYASRDRSLTSMLRAERWPEAASHLGFYGCVGTRPENIARAVVNVANRDTATAATGMDPAAVENRETRNIRIGRRRDANV